jgi:uncharacterized SAM-binding protein YcdF (DUF218 family)
MEEGKQKDIQTVWNYMKMNHTLSESDVIFALGSWDTRVAERAAALYLQGLAPLVVCSGSGTCNSHQPEWNKFQGRSEAEVFADIAIAAGVPKERIIIESESQNTGQNYEFASKLLNDRGVNPSAAGFKCIAVQKSFMERRTYATGKIWWPTAEILVTSPVTTLEQYQQADATAEGWIHFMVGDLQRIKEYPSKGFQIAQDIPTEVWEAYEKLVTMGFTKALI